MGCAGNTCSCVALIAEKLKLIIQICTGHRDQISWNAAYERLTRKEAAEHRTTLHSISRDRYHRGHKASFEAKRDSDERLKKVNDYTLAKTIGKGSFGEVFLAWKGWKPYAIKVLRKSALKRMRKSIGGSPLEGIRLEVATMKKIAHPNCVHMFDVVVDPAVDEVRRPQLTRSLRIITPTAFP